MKDSFFKYAIIENGTFKNEKTNLELQNFLQRNEGKIIQFQYTVIGDNFPKWRRYAYYNGYIVPAFVQLLNENRTRFPEISIETKATVKDFLQRLFIGEDENGNALSLKHLSDERFMKDFIEPIIAFAAIMFNCSLEFPSHNWRNKNQLKIKSKKVVL